MKTNPLECDLTKTLIALVKTDGEAAPLEIGMALRPRAKNTDMQADSARKALRPLTRDGHVIKLAPGVYRITERGRIAAALAMASLEISARR